MQIGFGTDYVTTITGNGAKRGANIVHQALSSIQCTKEGKAMKLADIKIDHSTGQGDYFSKVFFNGKPISKEEKPIIGGILKAKIYLNAESEKAMRGLSLQTRILDKEPA